MKSNMQIISAINDKITDLDQDEIDTILWMLDFHACEPSAASERIAEYLGESLGITIERDLIYSLL